MIRNPPPTYNGSGRYILILDGEKLKAIYSDQTIEGKEIFKNLIQLGLTTYTIQYEKLETTKPHPPHFF